MSADKTPISGATDYTGIGEYWDTHDLADVWGRTSEAEFTVRVDGQATLVALDTEVADRLRAAARRRGVSSQTLVNLWVQERLAAEVAK